MNLKTKILLMFMLITAIGCTEVSAVDFQKNLVASVENESHETIPDIEIQLSDRGFRSQVISNAHKRYFEKTYRRPYISTDGIIKVISDFNITNELDENNQMRIGEASDFIGEIPHKNKLDIVSFKKPSEEDRLDSEGLITTFYCFKGKFCDARWARLTQIVSINKDTFYVVAPDDMFETDSGRDPVVIYPVTGGFLIVTMWGAEEDVFTEYMKRHKLQTKGKAEEL